MIHKKFYLHQGWVHKLVIGYLVYSVKSFMSSFAYS